MITAGACVVALAVICAIWGGLYGFHPSATIYGTASPGWEGAGATAAFYLIVVGPPIALAGFVVGFVVVLVRSLTRSASGAPPP
jgi:hypothetical protein